MICKNIYQKSTIHGPVFKNLLSHLAFFNKSKGDISVWRPMLVVPGNNTEIPPSLEVDVPTGRRMDGSPRSDE